MLLVSDASRRGVQAANRISVMVGELKLKPRVEKLIINRAPDGIPSEGVLNEIEKLGLDLIGVVPQDETVYMYDADGKPSASVSWDSPVKLAVRDILNKLGL